MIRRRSASYGGQVRLRQGYGAPGQGGGLGGTVWRWCG